MPKAGDTLINLNDEQLRFVHASADTSGEYLEMEVTYIPHSDKPPAHYHPFQEEFFTVLAGEFLANIDGEEHTFTAGDTFTVPAGARHWMQNVADEEGKLNWQVRPALDTESFFETMWALANAEYGEYEDDEYDEYDDEEYDDEEEYEEDEASRLDLLQLSLTLREFNREFRLSKPPYAVQRIVFGALATLARRRGYKARHTPNEIEEAEQAEE